MKDIILYVCLFGCIVAFISFSFCKTIKQANLVLIIGLIFTCCMLFVPCYEVARGIFPESVVMAVLIGAVVAVAIQVSEMLLLFFCRGSSLKKFFKDLFNKDEESIGR